MTALVPVNEAIKCEACGSGRVDAVRGDYICECGFKGRYQSVATPPTPVSVGTYRMRVRDVTGNETPGRACNTQDECAQSLVESEDGKWMVLFRDDGNTIQFNPRHVVSIYMHHY